MNREKVIQFIKSVVALEEQMEPFKESLKDLKANYKENGWLDAKEQQMVMQAYRLYKKEQDVDEIAEITQMFQEEGLNGDS